MIARLAISCYFCNLDGAKIQKIENIIWLFPILLLPLHPIFEVNTERCKGCQLCIIACPQKVIALANKVNLHGYPYVEAVNEEACVGCASCGIVCPDGCITVYRKKVEE